MFADQTLTDLLKIKYPIIQAGMVWVAGAKLAAAAAESGCLGVIGAGSMGTDLLRQHIIKAKSLTSKPIAVNVPLLYKNVEEQINIALNEGINIFITSAGSPKKFTNYLKDKGCTVIHVTSSAELAVKCERAGVDAVVAEGFEAGGHNGREEITTMVLIPQVVDAVKIPVIAAGGISCGRQILAALSLGAVGVQIGSRFVVCEESSAHMNFKKAIIAAKPGDTLLTMKSIVPVRLLKNQFFQEIFKMESEGATKSEILQHLGKGRARRGMLEGDIENGELEIGQVAGNIQNLPSCQKLVQDLLSSYEIALKRTQG